MVPAERQKQDDSYKTQSSVLIWIIHLHSELKLTHTDMMIHIEPNDLLKWWLIVVIIRFNHVLCYFAFIVERNHWRVDFIFELRLFFLFHKLSFCCIKLGSSFFFHLSNSWISEIFHQPLIMIEPLCEFGILSFGFVWICLF